MGDMSLFWNLWIIVPTIGGLLACLWIMNWLTNTPSQPGGKVETMGHVWDENLEEYNNPLPRWWLNLFYITIFFAFGYLLFYPGLGGFGGLLGWSTTGAWKQEMQAADAKYGPIFEKFLATPIETLAADEDAHRAGERLYASYCATCHGSDARGVRGFPNLRDKDWIWGGEPAAIVKTIQEGRQGMMPAWSEILDQQQIADVVTHVLRISGADTDPVAAERGKAVFAQNCAACHGAEGKGMEALGAPNLTDEIWLYGGSSARITETIVKGRMGRMPAWGEFLGPAKVHVVSAYVWSLSNEAGASGGTGGHAATAVAPTSGLAAGGSGTH
ncbi:MAG TPA: cytochrome-c oxidase, cbb3-type subunit III [Gammaproteobacteria bacterium]|nr:cytochrome-c oxidase, cbb3-type subunit III [Gammaproteobacteria bacterium]